MTEKMQICDWSRLFIRLFSILESCVDGVERRCVDATKTGLDEKDIRILRMLSDTLEKLIELEKLLGVTRSPKAKHDIDEFRIDLINRIKQVCSSQ